MDGAQYSMADIASPEVIMFEMAIYVILSMMEIGTINLYAAKKLGGRDTFAYMALRVQRFISLTVVSVYALVVFYWARFVGLEVSRQTLVYMGVPFFVMWVFHLFNVVRRVKAETSSK